MRKIVGSDDGAQGKIWDMSHAQFQLNLNPLTRPLNGGMRSKKSFVDIVISVLEIIEV